MVDRGDWDAWVCGNDFLRMWRLLNLGLKDLDSRSCMES